MPSEQKSENSHRDQRVLHRWPSFGGLGETQALELASLARARVI